MAKPKMWTTEKKIILEVLILFASIPVFRGLWELMDLYFIREDPAASAWWSLIIGVVGIIAVLYYFNKPYIRSRLKNL